MVGGAVRDALLGRATHDWDVATAAHPEVVLRLFPRGRPQGDFGTVIIDDVQVTTFRRDHRYADHRRPDQVTFTDDLDEDLARRDFTVNAIAWGRGPRSATEQGERYGQEREQGHEREQGRERAARSGERELEPVGGFRDPMAGLDDLDAEVLRAVGDPDRRFEEDALRLLRAARFAATLGFTIEPATLAAMGRHADDAAWLSGERIGAELCRMVVAARPSIALRILMDTGVLGVVLPELALQRGVPQSKVPGRDLWDHTLGALDATASLAPGDQRLALAALLHDVGKPSTFADGHFMGHAEVGAAMAEAMLHRLRHPGREVERIGHLIREHMFHYERAWSDAAVRRFLKRVGQDDVDDLLRLRQADSLGSGLAADAGELAELRERLAHQRAAGVPLTLAELAVDGNDLQRELGRVPGPWLGELLQRLLDSVVNDPTRNTRARLLTDAREWLATV